MIKFCPKCHKEAYRLVEEGENVKVVLPNGNTVLNIGQKSSVSMSINCPSNHAVKLEIKSREEDG
ncbi:unnamed protein product [marine sediment metagenome]|uniref:Uncharacterized protein n=1 Tax=marine sediment metagenome TaxID=412755 RepID=X1KCS5_9ZZZZ